MNIIRNYLGEESSERKATSYYWTRCCNSYLGTSYINLVLTRERRWIPASPRAKKKKKEGGFGGLGCAAPRNPSQDT